MAVQGFFSPDRKTRMAGEKENNAAFSVKVKPVTLANNINQYNEQTPSLDYAPDRVGEYIKESETKSYTPKKDTSYVSAESYKPNVKTFDQQFGEAYQTHKEKREQVYSAINKDLNVGPLGDANLPSGIETKLIGSKYKYVKDGQELTRKEKKELEKDMALRTQLGKYVRERQFNEMSDLSDKERASYVKNMPDPDDRKIDFYTQGFPDEKVKPFEQRKFDYQRENINYGTAEDGTPTATVGGMTSKYGEDAVKVYGTEQLKKFIAADAKQDFENKEGGYAEVDERPKEISSFEKFFMGLPGVRGRENKALSKLSTSQLVQRDKENYGSTFPKGSFGTEKTRLEKAKEEQENKNILQRVGDFVGDTFNKLTGTEAAGAGTLQAQGINTSATTNIAQMGNVDPVTQVARDAVARANLRKSGLDKTIGGQSSQANYGSGRTGGFGTGTHGKGMPSNPGSQRQTGVGVSAGNLSRHKAGSSTSRGGISRSTSRGQGGGPSSRSRGGTGTGKSSQGRGGRRGGSTGGSGASSKGGTGSGRTSTSRTASKASRSRTGRSRSQCDIRTKIDISPLINSNLVKDNLAEVAYFVQEIKK